MRSLLRRVASMLCYSLDTTGLISMGYVWDCFRAKSELVLLHTKQEKEHYSCSAVRLSHKNRYYNDLNSDRGRV